MSKISILEISLNNMIDSIYPVIISDEQEMVLIDCGYPGFLPMIKEAAQREDLDLNKLTKVIITHHDFDHMGSLAQMKKEYPKIEIMASVQDEKYISGKEKSLRLQQAEALYDQTPELEKEGARGFQKMLKSVEPAEVDVCLEDKQVLDICGGIEIIATPGHMPGHISIYHRESRTLITGDALVIEQGRLVIANPQYTLDMETAKASVRKLLAYETDMIICYHGGVFTGNREEAIGNLLD